MKIKLTAHAKAAIVAAACLLAALPAPDLRAQDRRPFHFAVMGCAHMGVCEARDYALAVAKIKEQKPEFVVFLGGMADIPREGDVEAVWREFDSITARLGVPVHNLPGTCSWGPLQTDRDKTARAEKCFAERYPKRYYSFEYRNSLFILLDSDSAGGADGRGNAALSAGQVAFLKKAVAGAEKFDNVFLFAHDAQWLRENLARRLGDAYPLALKKVKYVFAAKEHFFNAEKLDGLTFVATGSPPCALKHATHPVLYHFLDVSVNGAQASVNVVPLKKIPLENLLTAGKGRKAERSYPVIKPALMDSDERKVMLPAERIIAAMDIKPGLRIADVGAGVGVFAFRFAEALKGTGMVYATDTDQEMIKALKKTAAAKGYKNFTAVSVSPEGADPFYKAQTFDLMFFSELYHYLGDPAAYFRELKPSLAPETGRLYIIHFRNAPDFGEIEFGDFRSVLKTLKSGMDSPAYSKAGAGLEDFVSGWQGGEVPPAVRERIVANFNSLLAAPDLFYALAGSPIRGDDLESPERGKALLKTLFSHDLNLARWLITKLERTGALEKPADRLTEEEKRDLRGLNRALLAGAFKLDKLDYLKGVYPLYADKERIVSDLEAAGYKFVRSHDFLTYHHFLEFR